MHPFLKRDILQTEFESIHGSCTGAKTTDIIEFYVNSIKILRGLDPTGILLETASGPTRQYLQTRKDAIRCIVSAMTDESAMAGESLYDELHRPAEEVRMLCCTWCK